MRGVGTVGLMGLSLVATAASPTPAEAGCQRSIVNRSNQFATVSRDGGPYVTIPPGAMQPIRLMHPGRIDVRLSCSPPDVGPGDGTVYSGSFSYNAIVDRCYIQFDDGFFRDYLGGGFFGFRDTSPLTLNNPRQGDLIVGPQLNARCRPGEGSRLRSLY